MYLKVLLLLLLLLGWNGFAIFILSFNLTFKYFNKWIMANFVAMFSPQYNSLSAPFKTKLFEQFNQMKNKEGKLVVVEVGAGSGANFDYFNVPASVQVVEPNKNFAAKLEEKKAKFPELDISFVQGFGEDMGSAGIETGSADAVVMTLVLCSVKDQVKVIKEVNRVLKPGGKFFYMEHIIAPKPDPIRYLQTTLTQSGFWSFFFDDCCLDREAPTLEQPNIKWSNLEETRFYLPNSAQSMLKPVIALISSHVMGVAEK